LLKELNMRYVLIPLSLIGFAYGMMHDFVWLELLTGGYLTSVILLGSSGQLPLLKSRSL